MSPTALVTHVHLELWGVEGALLDDPSRLEAVLLEAARAAKCQVLGSVKHQFQPHGATVLVLVAESHLSIHTWPEHGYAAADILTCGQSLPEEGVKTLIALMNPARSEVRRYERGIVQPL
jgi:S-adenosylmethionine decarboxylase